MPAAASISPIRITGSASRFSSPRAPPRRGVTTACAGGLPFGLQKRVELARAIAGEPKLLLLDEPAGGLNHDEVEELVGTIKQIAHERNITILLVEHHMSLVMAVSDIVVAIDFGRKIAEGTPVEIQNDEAVQAAYLGTSGGRHDGSA